MSTSLGGAVAIVVLMLMAGRVSGQATDHSSVLESIAAEGRERSHVERLFAMLTDEFGARLAGSSAYDRAAEWAREALQGWGLADARLDPVEFGPGWQLDHLTIEMTSPRYEPLIGVADAWSLPTAGELTGAPLYIGAMTPEEIRGIADRVRGAIVLNSLPQTHFFRGDRVQPTLFGQPVRAGPPLLPATRESAQRTAFNVYDLPPMGPAVVLSPSPGQHGTVFIRSSRPSELPLPNGDTLRSSSVPSVTLAAEHYNMLVRLVEAGAPVELRVEIRSRILNNESTTSNVLADLPGVDPVLRNEVVMIGAHLDSWHGGAGATDNADAVAAALEAMRILTAIDARAPRTIRLALWGAEEHGLLGSQAYVDEFLAEQAARDAVSVYLNDDPGTGPTFGFYMEENPGAKMVFDEWLGLLGHLGVRRNVFEGIGGTDHVPFDVAGIPAFTAIKDYTDYDTRTHHTNMDLPERVSKEDLTQSAIVLASMAWLAAVADERVPRRALVDDPTRRWGVSVGSTATAEPISGARVTMEGLGFEGMTDEHGFLVLESVPAGRHTVVVEHPDFATFRRENFPIRVDKLRFMPIWLDPR